MATSNLRLATRALARSPGWCALVLVTLALGVGANTAVFALVHALLLRPLPFPEPERLVRVQALAGERAGKLSAFEWEELQADDATFAGVAAYYPSQYNLAEGAPPESVTAAMATGNLFDVLGVRPLLGASWPLEAYRQRNASLVLGHALWSARFGRDANIVGRSVTMDASPYQIVGVAPPGFDFPGGMQIFRAANLLGPQNSEARSLFVLARLRHGVTLAQAQARLDALAERLRRERPRASAGVELRLTPLRDLFVGDVRPYLAASFALAGVVLLLAGVNLLHLLLLRAGAQRHGLALRAALGASGARLATVPLAECVLLGGAGGLLALGLARVVLGALRVLLPTDLPAWLELRVDAPVAAFALLAAPAVLLAAGVAPALLAARARPIDGLAEGRRAATGGPAQRRTRARLVLFEAAFAVLLLSAAGLLLRSLERLLAVDPGFRRGGLVAVRTDPPWARYDSVEETAPFYRRALEELRALPGVVAAAANHSLPLFGNDNYGRPRVLADNQDEVELARSPFVNLQIVSPDYFATLGIPLVAGRAFGPQDAADAPGVALIGRSLAQRLFGAQPPLGRRLRLPELLRSVGARQQAWFEVVGVVGDVLGDGLAARPSLDVYLSNQQQFAGDTYFVLRTAGAARALGQGVAAAVQRVDPEQSVFGLESFDTRLERLLWQRRAAARLAVGFALLALVLAVVGTYGVLAQGVEQRRRELGVRLALGASGGGLARLVLGAGLRPALAGVGLGLALATAAGAAARALLHGVAPWDPSTLAGAATLLLAATALAAAWPAWRAARVDPALALRGD